MGWGTRLYNYTGGRTLVYLSCLKHFREYPYSLHGYLDCSKKCIETKPACACLQAVESVGGGGWAGAGAGVGTSRH